MPLPDAVLLQTLEVVVLAAAAAVLLLLPPPQAVRASAPSRAVLAPK